MKLVHKLVIIIKLVHKLVIIINYYHINNVVFFKFNKHCHLVIIT